jgi:hypothetical protein
MPDQVSRTHPRSGRALAAYVEADSGDLRRLIVQSTHRVDLEPRGRVLRGQGVLESAIAWAVAISSSVFAMPSESWVR